MEMIVNWKEEGGGLNEPDAHWLFFCTWGEGGYNNKGRRVFAFPVGWHCISRNKLRKMNRQAGLFFARLLVG